MVENAPKPDVNADYYAALGVPADATQPQIASAFRRQARAWHPDTRPKDSGAAARFRQIVDAYRVLADPRRRREYDRARAAAPRPARSTDDRPGKGEQPPRPRPGRGRPVQVRYIRRQEGGYPAGESAQQSQRPEPRPAPRRRPHIVPLSPQESFPDDSLRDLIGRLRSLLYDRW